MSLLGTDRPITKASWMESSTREILLAGVVARTFYTQESSPEVLALMLDDLALHVLYGGEVPSEHSVVTTCVRNNPDLLSVDLSQPFPICEDELTTNFFGRLAYELSSISGETVKYGVVATPPALAIDMVAVSAAVYVSGLFEGDVLEAYKQLFVNDSETAKQSETLKASLKNVLWYDPCVGGGVFPIAVLSVLKSLGMYEGLEVLSRIRGRDIDPVAVAATRIRVAAFISASFGLPYAEVWSSTHQHLDVGDSLQHFWEAAKTGERPLGEESHLFDITIGNPPYVRANRIPAATKQRLRQAFPSVAGGFVDLYSYFLSHGVNSLRQGGILCFVSPSSFRKSKSGRGSRSYIRNAGSVSTLFDFNELPVFKGANIHPSVYTINKGLPQGDVLFHAYRELPTNSPLLEGLRKAERLAPTSMSVEGWQLGDDSVLKILDLLNRDAVPLSRYAGGVLSGIKTGFRKAFYLSREEAQFIQTDEASRRYIKPMLLPVNIKRWHPVWNGHHLALVKKGEVLPEGSLLMARFLQNEASLRARQDVSDHSTWYGLRHCGYYSEFCKPKITFPDISSSCRFAMDTGGFLIPDGAFIIPSDDFFLLGLLNSCIGAVYFRARCNTIGNPYDGGRLRFKKSNVQDFPVPSLTRGDEKTREEISSLAKSLSAGGDQPDLEHRLNLLALQLYRVPHKMWTFFLMSEAGS